MLNDEERFDFEEHSESDEDLDFSKIIECPHCYRPIPNNATLCLYCGKGVLLKRTKSVWFILVVFILVTSFLIWVLFR